MDAYLPPALPFIASIIAHIHDNLTVPVYLRQFKRIISTSELYAKSSNPLQKFRDSAVVIPGGVDIERFNPSIDGSPRLEDIAKKIEELYREVLEDE